MPKALNLQETLNELHALAAFFLNAEATIKDGGAIDMSGMDERVTVMCEMVQNAPIEQQQLYLPELTTLLTLLDACEQAIHNMTPASEDSGP
ncbi:MAG: hypothetical protein FWF24_05515 [Alphaproteobacteria bacterium]|nr:hypothetical protein [Alphaproteobacteria bacterium]